MKNEILINLIYFLSAYIIFFLIYIFIINRKRKKYEDCRTQLEISYIVNKFNLDLRKTKLSTIKWALTFLNPLIISITFLLVINIESFTFAIIVGFIVMLLLVYSCYEILGRILKKKGDKNV